MSFVDANKLYPQLLLSLNFLQFFFFFFFFRNRNSKLTGASKTTYSLPSPSFVVSKSHWIFSVSIFFVVVAFLSLTRVIITNTADMMLNQEDATTYQPSSAVKWLHERQRWDKDFHTVSNDFPNILDTEDRKPWRTWLLCRVDD